MALKSNPLLSLLEFVDDVVAGKSIALQCQWRGAVVPSQRLSGHNLSEFLRDSHVRSSTEEEAEAKNQRDAEYPEPFALEMADGTLVSFFLVRGSRMNMEFTDIAVKAEDIATKLAAYMNGGRKNTYSFGFHFLHDPRTAQQVFNQKIAPLVATAARLGGNAKRFAEDLGSRMVQGAAEELTLITLRTHKRALRSDEISEAAKAHQKLMGNIMKSGKAIPGFGFAINAPYGQALISKSGKILQTHEGMVNTLLTDFNSRRIGISITLLGVAESFEIIRRFADREIPFTPGWKGRLYGDNGSMRSAVDDRNLMPTPLALGMQVMERKVIGHIGAVETSTIGRTWYGSTIMIEGPVSPRDNPEQTTFDSLMKRIKAINIPFSMTFDVMPSGLEFNKLNQAFNTFLGALGSNNRQIRSAYKEARDYQEKNGTTDPIIGLRVAFSTWAGTKERAESALLELNLAVQGWGGAKASSESGAPDYARLSAVPEFLGKTHAPTLPAPLQEAIYMSPIMRPASPWDEGQVLFKTNDGVIYPVAFGSNLHASYAAGICAPSGSGKSFVLNRIHACMALSPGAMSLPYVCNIDVAPSGVGFLRLLKTILPESLHHQLIYFKVINDPQYCVNPFDVQLGCIGPTEPERDFITAVLEIVFDGLGPETPQFVSAVIDEAYKFFAPEAVGARLWQGALNEEVSAALDEIGYKLDPDRETTVFSIVDVLFAAGKLEMARVAQRYAVPRMEDLTRVIVGRNLKQKYDTARSGDEAMLDKASRMIQNAVEQFPILSSVTRVDIDNARISVIDLQNVVGGTSESGLQFAGMMYLYARHLGARNYFLHEDDIRLVCRPAFLSYQEARVREIRQTPKMLTYDEWHNVRRVKGIVGLNEKETRETRKFKIYITFVTQYITDLPDAILDGLTSIFVVGQASQQQNVSAKEKLGLSKTDLNILNTGLDRMGRIWAWFRLRDGPVTAVINNDVGPLETWCYTTHDNDSPLREELSRHIGETAAVVYLAEVFKTGSAASYLERRSRQLADEASSSQSETIITIVARELAASYELAMRAAEAA